MLYGELRFSEKRVSRLVMGCHAMQSYDHAAEMFDDFFARGGTAFDTAWNYGYPEAGAQEDYVGRWAEARDLVNDLFITIKGAHHPLNHPDAVEPQLIESLARLRVERADLYLTHHDNKDVPVEDYVDVLDALVRKGLVRAYGFSNWTLARVDEAIRYARQTGKAGPQALSSHFGLAEVLELPWPLGQHVTDDASRAWLEQAGIPLFSWSSQSRGFFARGDSSDESDAALVRSFYSPLNFERLARVRVIALEQKVEPTAVALAYVLRQPFPTFALIGPLSLAETRASLECLRVELSPGELDWLHGSPSRTGTAHERVGTAR